ncbi:membrane-associated phospholipid phosphatase [Chitinophaga skermanii]|uniref:Membrane-associated phospholipid phosphatase n=1 Tax=Chitinophaga skermanii TaxID=331697 RepID=A0A327QIT1_9BACT|nr:phosphatase PAP2 family protein [Chitinophaga skermanii]RAJ04260.1 membrane-associated phospholipid phosphatase [Chitinophaga skermanii]
MKTLLTLVRKNRYFFVPFLAWAIIGGLLPLYFSKETLFLTINGPRSLWLDYFQTGLTYIGDGVTFGALLIGLLIGKKFRLFLVGTAAFLFVAIVVQLIKHYIDAPRPIAYFPDPSIVHTVAWVNVHSSLSFPSGHTSTAFAMCCFTAMMLPVKAQKWALALFAIALLAGYSRIYLAQHFYEDVYVGSIIGTTASLLMFWLFELRNTGAAYRQKTALQNATANLNAL